MKHIIWLFACTVFCFLCSIQNLYGQALDQGILELRGACEKLMDAPGDQESLEALMTYAKNTNGVDRLRSRCMVGIALSALFTGNTNLYLRARDSHARIYPEDTHLLRINLRDCLIACAACNGQGYIVEGCPACQGKGVSACSVCRGSGARMNKQALKGTRAVGTFKCQSCNGTGKVTCHSCGGNGATKTVCKACAGKPYTYKVSPQVNEDFGLAVRGVVKWINNEEVFQQKYHAAKKVTDIDQRIAEFKSLIKTYSYRDEAVEMDSLLAADMKVVKERDRIAREAEFLERQEIQVLMRLKDSEAPLAAATTIREYLATHPDCRSKVELQVLASQLEAKYKQKRRQRHMIYVFCGVLTVLFGLSCIHINYYKYDVFNSRSRLPEDKG